MKMGSQKRIDFNWKLLSISVNTFKLKSRGFKAECFTKGKPIPEKRRAKVLHIQTKDMQKDG